MSAKKPIRKLKAGDTPVVRTVASDVIRILTRAASGSISKRKADDMLEELMVSNRERLDYTIVGKLSSRAKEDKFADVHIPLKNGGTLTIGVSGPGVQPLSYSFGRWMMLSPFLGDEEGTIKYYMTKTDNNGLEDSQGDSRKD